MAKMGPYFANAVTGVSQNIGNTIANAPEVALRRRMQEAQMQRLNQQMELSPLRIALQRAGLEQGGKRLNLDQSQLDFQKQKYTNEPAREDAKFRKKTLGGYLNLQGQVDPVGGMGAYQEVLRNEDPTNINFVDPSKAAAAGTRFIAGREGAKTASRESAETAALRARRIAEEQGAQFVHPPDPNGPLPPDMSKLPPGAIPPKQSTLKPFPAVTQEVDYRSAVQEVSRIRGHLRTLKQAGFDKNSDEVKDALEDLQTAEGEVARLGGKPSQSGGQKSSTAKVDPKREALKAKLVKDYGAPATPEEAQELEQTVDEMMKRGGK